MDSVDGKIFCIGVPSLDVQINYVQWKSASKHLLHLVMADLAETASSA